MKLNMQFYRIVFLSTVLLFGFGCSQNKDFSKKMTNDLFDSLPVFLDIDVGKEDIKTFTYGSHGWVYENPYNTSFIYAWFGNHIIRYNILENNIDRIVKFGNFRDGSIDRNVSLNPNGNHAVVYETSENVQSNIYLLDFENSQIKWLAEKQEDLIAEHLSESLREDFKIEKYYIGWKGKDDQLNFQNLDKLNYTIKHKYDSYAGTSWVVTDKYGNGYELAVLKNNLNTLGLDSIPCVAIDPETAGAILPPDESPRGDLGYYKFVLINLKTGEIIQACPINE